MRSAVVLLLSLVCMPAVGCGTTNSGDNKDGSVSPEQISQLENELRQRPPLEAAHTQYEAAIRQMADRITALVSGLTWTLDQNTWTGCGGNYARTSGKQVYQMAVFTGPIPEQNWPRAVQIVKDGAASYGAGNFGAVKDQPGDHDVYISGADGVQFQLATQKASTLTAKSDCRLSQTDTPTPASHP